MQESAVVPWRTSRGLRWGLAALFAAVVSLAVLQFSFRHGRLVALPGYDDVGYFADGVQCLQAFYDAGVPGLVRLYKEIPPHSPFESAMALTAFTLFGIHDWAPYVLNSLLALTYFLAADRFLRGISLWQKAMCLAFLATLPFVAMAVHEFRPDHAVALFTAIGAFMLLSGPFVYGPRRRQIAGGVWLGVAMLTKPPVFPQTVVLGCAAIVLATLSDWAASGRLPRPKAIAKAWMVVLIPFVLIPLPHYVYNHHNIISYINDILFGTFKHSYQMQGTRREHLMYYLTGQGGTLMLGKHVEPLFVMLVAGFTGIAIFGMRGDKTRSAAMGAAYRPRLAHSHGQSNQAILLRPGF